MTVPARSNWKKFWLGLATTDEADGWLPSMQETRVGKTSVFPARLTIGAADLDSDDLISTLSAGDWSGGGQIEEMSGADASRFWWGIFDGRSPRQASLPPLVLSGAASGASGTCRPLGVVNDTFYVAFGTDIVGLDEGNCTTSALAWYTKETMTYTPTGKGINFHGALYVPCGSSGYVKITESATGNPVVTTVAGAADPSSNSPVPTSNPKVVDFCIAEGDKLFALTKAGHLAWSLTGDTDDWNWDYQVESARFPKLHTGFTPYHLVQFFNRSGVPTLFIIHSGGAHLYNRNVPQLEETPIQFPIHADVGKGATVWRTGEDLWISAGLDIVHYTSANVVVPLSGLSRDAGVPADYLGAVVDIQPELSCLYALAGGVSQISSMWAYDSKFVDADGVGGEFSTPKQIALDSSGNIYVADSGSDQILKFTSGGVFDSVFVSGLDQVFGLCIDSNDNVYVNYYNGVGYKTRSYDSSGTLRWTDPNVSVAVRRHITTDDTYVYLTQDANAKIVKLSCDDGSSVDFFGTLGTGNGEFTTPYGIAYNPISGYLYVVDQGNDRVQYLTTSGTYVGKWGSSGTSDGKFTTATGIAVHPTTGDVYVLDSGRDDCQVFTSTGTFGRVFGASGTGNGQFAAPDGIVIDSSDALWISDTQAGTDRIQKFVISSTSSSLTAKPFLGAWTGTGWQGLWEGTSGDTPSWMQVSNTTGAYRLSWGLDDGNLYSMKLRRTLHNPRQGILAGVDTFASSGYVETSRADMGMLGFTKIASHVIVFMRAATADESLTVEYEIDDGGWNLLGTVTTPGRTVLPFESTTLTLDDGTTETTSRGIGFNWIRLRLSLARGSTVTLSPVIRAVNLHFLKVPQNSTTFQFTVPIPRRNWNGKTAPDITDYLDTLQASTEMVLLRQHDRLYRGRISQVTGNDATGDDYAGVRNVSFVEVQDS